MALVPATTVFVGGMLIAAVTAVLMRQGLRSLGRQFGISKGVAWGCYTLAILGLASISALSGSLPENSVLTVGLWALYFPGWLGLTYAASNYGIHRVFRQAPARETGEITAGDGHVVVSGEVSAVDEPATTPLLGDSGLCYTWTVENRTWWPRVAWTTAALGQGGGPFTVDDGSGPVRIDPDHAELRLIDVRTKQVDADETPATDTIEFLEDVAVGFDPSDTTHRYRERRLEAGATASVLGRPRSPEAGEHPGTTVVDGGDPFLVAAGSAGEITTRLGRTIRAAGTVGLLGVALGYAGMVLASGSMPV